MLLVCDFIVASCSISLVMLIQIALLWEDLSAGIFINGQGRYFWIGVFRRDKSAGLEEATPQSLVFLTVCEYWTPVQSKLFLWSILAIFWCDLCLFMDHYFGH